VVEPAGRAGGVLIGFDAGAVAAKERREIRDRLVKLNGSDQFGAPFVFPCRERSISFTRF
jgi:hypothetical protein